MLTKRIEYDYDARGRLIRKRVDDDGDNNFDRGERYVYDASGKTDPATGVPLDDIVLVFNDPPTGSSSLTNRFLHGPAIDQVFADENNLNEILWQLADHQGTIRDVVSYDDIADTTTVENHLQYNAFGRITSETDATQTPLHTYTGRLLDEDTSLTYHRARWFDPAVGKWLSEDPAGFAASDANLTRYVTNTSINLSDPSGLEVLLVFRQFAPDGTRSETEARDSFINGAKTPFGFRGPKVGHVFLALTYMEDGKSIERTFSFHPIRWPKPEEANNAQCGRVWENHPLDDSKADPDGDGTAMSRISKSIKSLEGKEKALADRIMAWIKNNGAGYDNGPPLNVNGIDHGKTKFAPPVALKDSLAVYWVSGSNCGNWAFRAITDVGGPLPKDLLDEIQQWNGGNGIFRVLAPNDIGDLPGPLRNRFPNQQDAGTKLPRDFRIDLPF